MTIKADSFIVRAVTAALMSALLAGTSHAKSGVAEVPQHKRVNPPTKAQAARQPQTASKHAAAAPVKSASKASAKPTLAARPRAVATVVAKPTVKASGVVKPSVARKSELVIAIDAGHGGKDTGAIGPKGLLEKNVVYSIARRLEAMIEAEPGMRPLMVRKGDQFIDLRERAAIARRARADLFISLHADAYENGEAQGSSVFTLSQRGASSEAARWLADSENAADLVGGVKLKGRDKTLASVLLDLSQSATLEASDKAATHVLNALRKTHHLHQRQVQKAGFVVLKSPDVPSLLIETAFISNPEEEKNLASPNYQELVARSIFTGIRAYCTGGGLPSAPVRTAETKPDKPLQLAQP